MYEELVKRLNAYSAEHEYHGGITAEAADVIEQLEGLVLYALDFIPRWIPAREAPALKVGDEGYPGYLVYANGYYEVADYTVDRFGDASFHVDGEYEPDITHYMPLPEPPKEET